MSRWALNFIMLIIFRILDAFRDLCTFLDDRQAGFSLSIVIIASTLSFTSFLPPTSLSSSFLEPSFLHHPVFVFVFLPFIRSIVFRACLFTFIFFPSSRLRGRTLTSQILLVEMQFLDIIAGTSCVCCGCAVILKLLQRCLGLSEIWQDPTRTWSLYEREGVLLSVKRSYVALRHFKPDAHSLCSGLLCLWEYYFYLTYF